MCILVVIHLNSRDPCGCKHNVSFVKKILLHNNKRDGVFKKPVHQKTDKTLKCKKSEALLLEMTILNEKLLHVFADRSISCSNIRIFFEKLSGSPKRALNEY